MKIMNVHAAKTHISRLVDEAAGGQEIIIAKAGNPVQTGPANTLRPPAKVPDWHRARGGRKSA